MDNRLTGWKKHESEPFWEYVFTDAEGYAVYVDVSEDSPDSAATLDAPESHVTAHTLSHNPNVARKALLRLVSGWDWLPAQVREALETEIPNE